MQRPTGRALHCYSLHHVCDVQCRHLHFVASSGPDIFTPSCCLCVSSQLSVLIFEFLVQCCQLVLDGLHLSGSACSWGQQCGDILTPAGLLHLLQFLTAATLHRHLCKQSSSRFSVLLLLTANHIWFSTKRHSCSLMMRCSNSAFSNFSCATTLPRHLCPSAFPVCP